LDLADQFTVPATGVDHDPLTGTVIVTESDRRVITLVEHPETPYSGRIQVKVKIASGSIARLFLSAIDDENAIAVELEPDTSPPTPCEGEFGWIRCYKIVGGVETLVGHEFIKLGIAVDTWLTVYVWWDSVRQRVSVQVDGAAAGEMVTTWFPTWVVGALAGFGTGTATSGAPVEFDDFFHGALGSIDDTNLDCGTAPHSCAIVTGSEMLPNSGSMPCCWDGTPGSHWDESSGSHRTVIADANVKASATFAFGPLDDVGDSTTAGITGGANSLTATLLEVAPIGDTRQFTLTWKLNGVTKRTITGLGIHQTGGVSMTVCPTIYVPGLIAVFTGSDTELPGTVPADPIGVTITQPLNGETKLTGFSISHHPKGLPTVSECPGCGTCRDICDPAFEEEMVYVDLGDVFLTEQSQFQWWPGGYNMCEMAQGVLELDVDLAATCEFEYREYAGSNFEYGQFWFVVHAKFYVFGDWQRWEVTVTLAGNEYFSGIVNDSIALYRVDNLVDCVPTDDGHWVLSLVSVTHYGSPSAQYRCLGTFPPTIKLGFDPTSL
jgi:hypothetical protein